MFQSQLLSGTVHWIHLIAAVSWLGGLIYSIAILRPALRDVEPASAARLALVSDMRFRIVALTALVSLLLTGLYMVSQILQGTASSAEFFGSPYGRILGIKIILAVIAIALGLTAGFWLAPRLVTALEERDEARTKSTRRLLAALSWTGLVLGILITFCVALLSVNA